MQQNIRKTARFDAPNDPVETSKGLLGAPRRLPRGSPGSPWILEGRLGAREGSMRAPDGPGEAPAGRPGGGVKCLFSYGFTVFQRFPCILRFGP